MLNKGLGSQVETERVPGRCRQVISHPCRGPKLRTQQSWIQMITAAMDAPVASSTRPFLLISVSEGEFSWVSTTLIKMSPCGLHYTFILYSSSWNKRQRYCFMETTIILCISVSFPSKNILCKCTRLESIWKCLSRYIYSWRTKTQCHTLPHSKYAYQHTLFLWLECFFEKLSTKKQQTSIFVPPD